MDKSENRVAMGYQTASFSIKQAYLHALYIFYVVSDIFPKNRKNYENKDNPPLSYLRQTLLTSISCGLNRGVPSFCRRGVRFPIMRVNFPEGGAIPLKFGKNCMILKKIL